jgi:hypothetical protein
VSARRVLPNLFVIGAPKAGTTSLHHYLSLHPEIAMSTVKEPQLFATGYPDGLARYEGLFVDPVAPVRGESSAVYSQYPHWADIPERIAREVPEARFVYVVRDPVERALAHFRQHVRDSKEGRSPAAAFAGFREPDHTYLAPSRYATQLERYLRLFDRDRVRVVDHARLLGERAATLAELFAFVGVDPAFSSPEFEVELNTRAHLRRPTAAGRLLRRSGLVGLARRVPLGGRLRRTLRGAVSRPIEAPELPAELRAELERELAGEAARLREITGLELAGWSV